MALRNLSQGTLITNTRYLVGPLRGQLLAHPTLAWAPPILDALLNELVALEDDPQAAVDAARQAATAGDAVFDHLTRAIFWICRAAASLALARGDDTRAQAYAGLREALLPAGLAVVNWSYVEESAEADRVEGRLDGGDRALMGATQVLGATLAELVGEWQAAARALGEADRARTDVEADVAANRLPALSRVRRRWMDTIRAMRAAAMLLSESERAGIFRKLDESEARADARVAARRAAGAGLGSATDVDEVMPLDGSDVRGEGAEGEAGEGEAAEAAPAPPAAEQPAAEPPAGAGTPPLRPIR